MIVPGDSLFVLGPSGTGKSFFLRSMLIEEKSGAVALAPGVDEWGSYSDLAEFDSFNIEAFTSVSKALKWLKDIYEENAEALNNDEELVHKVLGVDTFTGFDQLAMSKALRSIGEENIPAAQSPQGAKFYLGHRRDLEQIAHRCRLCRALGIHWVATAHTKVRVDEDSSLSDVVTGETIYAPIFTGQFRNNSPGAFDFVFHSGKRKKGRDVEYTLQWKSGNKKMAKSRYGDLADSRFLLNTWPEVRDAMKEAKEKRKNDLKKRLDD